MPLALFTECPKAVVLKLSGFGTLFDSSKLLKTPKSFCLCRLCLSKFVMLVISTERNVKIIIYSLFKVIIINPYININNTFFMKMTFLPQTKKCIEWHCFTFWQISLLFGLMEDISVSAFNLENSTVY